MKRLVPMLPVRSLAASVAFYERLGFRVERRNDAWGWAMLAVGELHRRLRDAGVAVPDLDVTFYGMTEFRIEDPDGNQLWIGQESAAPR